ncbi:MAG TPA: hypothetical protein VIJ33_07310 [Solirubrobacteraceae bacterium]
MGRDRGDELPEHLRTEEGRRQAFKAAKERLARKAGRGQEPEVAARARPKVLSDQAGQARVAS